MLPTFPPVGNPLPVTENHIETHGGGSINGSGVRFPEGTIYGVLINWQPYRVRTQICGKSLDDCLGLRVNDAIAV